ncbi:hypothetical protein [Geothrix sp. 21YS21S-4]|uniref:hypothetical protein n=1 Tax=Geothrix sp. 21YS21S-4 TaxID=3068889 RepID=UPI0027B8E077|nr:hypothetical protein [Geothrix sp. 21YS21S-4]
MPRRVLFISSLALGLVAAPRSQQEDPVLKVRAQRAASQGISEGDLPPVPRGIVEPPPLPPPELHVRDTPKGKRVATKAARKKGKAVASRKAGAPRGSAATKRKAK